MEELGLGIARRAVALLELVDTDLLNWFFQRSLSARPAGIFVWNSTSLSDKEWLGE